MAENPLKFDYKYLLLFPYIISRRGAGFYPAPFARDFMAGLHYNLRIKKPFLKFGQGFNLLFAVVFLFTRNNQFVF